ncbi:MAG: prepilin-type N-terminal cleavage/methylation domain-containing protein, partial [Nitrospinae bacterium]|nr:prepilin-type N-terminal cleavage/methylation domain-containing protein [Nitrospinota bacterium]
MNKSIKDRRSKIVNCNNGLTIVEMLVSIAILAIMAGLFT